MLMGSSMRVARMVTPVLSRTITSGAIGGGGPKICVGGNCNPPWGAVSPCAGVIPANRRAPAATRAQRSRPAAGDRAWFRASGRFRSVIWSSDVQVSELSRAAMPPAPRRTSPYRAPAASASSSRAISSVAVMPVFPSWQANSNMSPSVGGIRISAVQGCVHRSGSSNVTA